MATIINIQGLKSYGNGTHGLYVEASPDLVLNANDVVTANNGLSGTTIVSSEAPAEPTPTILSRVAGFIKKFIWELSLSAAVTVLLAAAHYYDFVSLIFPS